MPCGFKTSLFVYWGKSAVVSGKKGPIYDLRPAYCPNCRKIESIDIKKEPKCGSCGGAVMLYGKKRKVSRAAFPDQLDVPTTGQLCPLCQQFTMTFAHIGMWD